MNDDPKIVLAKRDTNNDKKKYKVIKGPRNMKQSRLMKKSKLTMEKIEEKKLLL